MNFAFSQDSLTEDDFFGENIVNNLVAFLGIPKNKIRVMEIVSAASKRRRRRSTESSLTTITVSNDLYFHLDDNFLEYGIEW